jgi:polyisoprenoid-binding protein YceI
MDKSVALSSPCNLSTDGVAKGTLSSKPRNGDGHSTSVGKARYTLRMRLGCLLLASLALASAARAEPRSYSVDPDKSTLRVRVGKTGLFSFAGHEHVIVATGFEGHIVADTADAAHSTVTLTFPVTGLKVAAEGEPPEDLPKVQDKLTGPEVLDMAHFAAISFHSTAIDSKASGPAGYDLQLKGELSLHGVTKPLTIPMHVELGDPTLTATGHVSLRQSDYAMKPVSVAGVVKVKDELALEFSIVARLAP